MGIEDMLGKAKDLIADHADTVEGAIDQAADAVKDKTPDQIDGAVDSLAEKAKGLAE